MIDCAQSIFKEQGIKGFYRGYVLCLMRSRIFFEFSSNFLKGFPISAVNFVIYEATLKVLMDYKVQ